jgi:hypothetical protein
MHNPSNRGRNHTVAAPNWRTLARLTGVQGCSSPCWVLVWVSPSRVRCFVGALRGDDRRRRHGPAAFRVLVHSTCQRTRSLGEHPTQRQQPTDYWLTEGRKRVTEALSGDTPAVASVHRKLGSDSPSRGDKGWSSMTPHPSREELIYLPASGGAPCALPTTTLPFPLVLAA